MGVCEAHLCTSNIQHQVHLQASAYLLVCWGVTLVAINSSMEAFTMAGTSSWGQWPAKSAGKQTGLNIAAHHFQFLLKVRLLCWFINAGKQLKNMQEWKNSPLTEIIAGSLKKVPKNAYILAERKTPISAHRNWSNEGCFGIGKQQHTCCAASSAHPAILTAHQVGQGNQTAQYKLMVLRVWCTLCAQDCSGCLGISAWGPSFVPKAIALNGMKLPNAQTWHEVLDHRQRETL